MPTTATYSVNNPVSGTEYIAPSAYWVIPNNATQVKCTVQAFDGSGNLLQVANLYAIVRDVSSSTDKASFNGNYNTASAIYSSPNGSDAYAAAGKVTHSGVARLAMYLTYTGSAYDQPPNAPTNLSPTGGAITGTTPTFQGTFTDPTAGDTLYAYQIVVNNGSNGAGSQVWDSGTINASSTEISNGAFSKVYSGAALGVGSNYSWKARMQNQNGNWGAYSGWQNFTTAQGPNAPSSVTPSGQQTTLTPNWGFTYTHPTAVAMKSYRYTITNQNGGATVYDSGTVNLVLASGASTSGSIPGGAGLVNSGAYYFNVYAIDNNNAQGPTTTVAFTIAPLPTVSPSSPVNGATVNTHTPTFAWSYVDQNYAQAQYQVQVINANTSASLWDSGVVNSAASSVVCGASIAFNTPIKWRVQVWDTAGLGSGYSAYAAATVIDVPQAAITSPTNGGTITSSTPTITWTYTPNSGSLAQASAQVLLMDSNNNVLQTYNLSGTGTSLAIPSGVLINNTTYHLQVKVTDTGSNVGSSSITSFLLQYVPPADMQGQPLAAGKNYITNPYLNSDVNSDGVADNFTSYTDAGVTAAFSIDGSILQPTQNPNGDGPFAGAQRIDLTAVTAGGKVTEVYQFTLLSTAGWTANSTHISAAAFAWLSVLSGSPTVLVGFDFYNGSTFLSSVQGSAQGDTAGGWVWLLGPQNALIPTNTTKVTMWVRVLSGSAADTCTAWFCGAQVEAAAASDAAFIGGSNGTGFSYDGNNFSVRSNLAGNLPTIIANPGDDSDPINATGGTITITWDTTLADSTRFTYYEIARRRMDQQTNDAAWVTLATVTNKQTGSYTDWTAGGNVAYQYSVRQFITYSDGAIGYSAHRAIVIGSVNYSPVWYLTNAQGTIYNWRLITTAVKRKVTWKERAVYSDFLGRVGQSRDAGPAQGYLITLTAYFNDTWGDDLDAIRRQLVQMQQLNVIWYLKSPTGLVVPVYLGDVDFNDELTGSDTLGEVVFTFQQAADTPDY